MRVVALYIFILWCGISCAKEILVDRNTNYINISEKNIEMKKDKDTVIQYFSIRNTTPVTLEITLDFLVENVKFLSVLTHAKQDTVYHSFNNEKISNRSFYDRDIVFEYTLSPNSVYNYSVKFVQTDKKEKIEMSVWNKLSRISNHQAIDLSRGFFYGFLVLFLLICLVLFLLIREMNYLRFFLYLFSGTLYLAVKHNLAYEFLWSNYPAVDFFIKKVILLLYLITGLNFFRSFIIKRVNIFSLDKYIVGVLYIGIFSIFISLGIGFFTEIVREFFYVFQYFYIIICVLLILASFYIAYFNVKDKSIFFFSITFFASFAFFLFYPAPSSSKYLNEINLKLLFPYLNTFIIYLLISFTIIWKVRQTMQANKAMRKEVGNINAQQNFGVVTAQLSERKRVGKELHDGIGIIMATAKMKLSSVKLQDEAEKETLKQIIRQLDNTTQKIRKFSHDLLPPTLIKFGLYIAINDEIEHFNEVRHNPIKFYTDDNISNLDEVSNYVIYHICINLIKYFYNSNNYKCTIRILIDVTNKHCDIQVAYSGNRINFRHKNIRQIEDIIGLLQGGMSDELINTFSYNVIIDFPIRLKEAETK